MSVQEVKEGLRVEEVYDGSPAKTSGLKVGNVIVSVNGKPLAGKTSDQSTALIKGPAGSTVTITLQDGRKLTMKRAKVDIPIVQSELQRADGKKIAWVRMAGFTSGSGTAVKDAVNKQLKAGAKGVVLDLRHNGGGLLNEAVTVASVFLPDGRVVSTKGRARPERVYNAEGGAIKSSIPVVVLVDGGSASASEIVTGALQDRKRAKVVGARTFGKGVFQEIENLSNGGALDITVGEYFTPTGRNLGGGGVRRGAGITPDIKATDNPKTPKDEALETALKTVADE
jgi:carboxyl-terminal processing protease